MCSLFCFKDQTSFFEFTPLYGLYPAWHKNQRIILIKELFQTALRENNKIAYEKLFFCTKFSANNGML